MATDKPGVLDYRKAMNDISLPDMLHLVKHWIVPWKPLPDI